jgi:magnesium transporter
MIHMFDLRLLIQADQVLLFQLEETPNHSPDTISRVFRRDLAGKLRGDQGLGVSVKLPYELRVLEAVLAAVTSTLEAEFVLAKKEVKRTLSMVDKEEGEVHSQLRTLLELVRTLAGIEKRARQVRSAVQELLNTDEDMADMYLSDKRAGRPHEPQDHQDVEYLLEAYYKASDSVVQESASLMGAIQQSEETMQSVLDVRRNQIMVLEAKIEILMLGLSVATLVAGWYGMNVINYFEDSPVAFGVLVSFCLVGIAMIGRYGFRRLRRIQRMHM